MFRNAFDRQFLRSLSAKQTLRRNVTTRHFVRSETCLDGLSVRPRGVNAC